MKILILGGAGLVGSALVCRLQQCSFHEIMVVDNLLYEADYLLNVPFRGGDVADENFMKSILKRFEPEVVVHLAGIVGDGACATRPTEAWSVNVDSVQILRDNFDGRILFPSSCSVYGVNDDLVTEESPLNPLSSYANMKIKAEEILEGANAFIPRLGTLHGVSGRLRNDLVVNVLTIRAMLDGKINVFGGDQYRPLLHVTDLVDVLFSHIVSKVTGIYNLVENNYKISEIADTVKKILPHIEVEVTQISFEDARNYRASALKAKTDWNFKAKYGIEETIRGIINIRNEGRIKDFSNVKYSNLVALQLKDSQ